MVDRRPPAYIVRRYVESRTFQSLVGKRQGNRQTANMSRLGRPLGDQRACGRVLSSAVVYCLLFSSTLFIADSHVSYSFIRDSLASSRPPGLLVR